MCKSCMRMLVGVRQSGWNTSQVAASVQLLLSNKLSCEEKMVVTHHSSALIVQTVQSCHLPSPDCFVRVVSRAVRSLCS